MSSILVVEDDAAIAELLQGVLEDEGYQVIIARDGVEALELLVHHPIRLILADLMMPRLNGRELRNAIASARNYARIPIVLMTAASNLPNGVPNDFSAVILKPFQIDTVIELVARLLSRPAELPADDG